MKISELRNKLNGLQSINFKLPDGSSLPPHFHVTEIGLVSKHFIDCGGTERKETVANFQLWEAGDYDHRLAPQKFLKILDISQSILGSQDLEIEVEYQQETIGKFALEFNKRDFILIPKQTACLAQDSCGIPNKPKILPGESKSQSSCCSPESGCC